ncbi:hypothetical protein D9M69_623770 [compost metagenome]
MPGGDPRQDDDEGPRRPGDLQAASPQQSDQQATDDGGVDALLGFDARRDGEGHGQWQCDDAHHRTGHQVTPPVLPPEQAGIPRLTYGNHHPLLNGYMCIALSCRYNDKPLNRTEPVAAAACADPPPKHRISENFQWKCARVQVARRL